MKLRLRSMESKDTLKLDVPDPCPLPQLRHILAGRLLSPPPPGYSFRLSLNRTDELRSPDPAASLQSLGLASGDLVYYSLIRDFFPEPWNRGLLGHAGAADSEKVDLVSEDAQRADASGTAGDPDNSVSGSVDFEGDGVLAVDGSGGVRSKFSEPCVLRRVLREVLGGEGGNHRLLVAAVHAVLLESGFVPADRFHLPERWPFTMSLRYSLRLNTSASVALNFQGFPDVMTVSGSLAEDLTRTVCLNEHRFAPIIDVMWAKGDDNVEANEDGRSSNSSSEKEVFEFWKIVKDGLALPLLINLTERVGLPPPPCFTGLPTELKLKILKLLSGIDLAKVGCVSSELRELTSDRDLWKQKYVEEFGEQIKSSQGNDWKLNFQLEVEEEKREKKSLWWRSFQMPPDVDSLFPVRIRTDPEPLIVPGVIGGDYDRLPGPGVPSPFGLRR